MLELITFQCVGIWILSGLHIVEKNILNSDFSRTFQTVIIGGRLYVPSEQQEPLTQHHSVTSQKTPNLKNISVTASNLIT
jgi:hypothetical protein